MFPLGQFSKIKPKPPIVESLDDVISIVSKLRNITGDDLEPIILADLNKDETKIAVGKALKERNLVVFTNVIQSYWSFGNFCFIDHKI